MEALKHLSGVVCGPIIAVQRHITSWTSSHVNDLFGKPGMSLAGLSFTVAMRIIFSINLEQFKLFCYGQVAV